MSTTQKLCRVLISTELQKSRSFIVYFNVDLCLHKMNRNAPAHKISVHTPEQAIGCIIFQNICWTLATLICTCICNQSECTTSAPTLQCPKSHSLTKCMQCMLKMYAMAHGINAEPAFQSASPGQYQ